MGRPPQRDFGGGGAGRGYAGDEEAFGSSRRRRSRPRTARIFGSERSEDRTEPTFGSARNGSRTEQPFGGARRGCRTEWVFGPARDGLEFCGPSGPRETGRRVWCWACFGTCGAGLPPPSIRWSFRASQEREWSCSNTTGSSDRSVNGWYVRPSRSLRATGRAGGTSGCIGTFGLQSGETVVFESRCSFGDTGSTPLRGRRQRAFRGKTTRRRQVRADGVLRGEVARFLRGFRIQALRSEGGAGRRDGGEKDQRQEGIGVGDDVRPRGRNKALKGRTP